MQVIFFDSDESPHRDTQAAARAHRLGQKHGVMCFRCAVTLTAPYLEQPGRAINMLYRHNFSSVWGQ